MTRPLRLARGPNEAGVSTKVDPAAGKTLRTIHSDLARPGDESTRASFEFLENSSKKWGRISNTPGA